MPIRSYVTNDRSAIDKVSHEMATLTIGDPRRVSTLTRAAATPEGTFAPDAKSPGGLPRRVSCEGLSISVGAGNL